MDELEAKPVEAALEVELAVLVTPDKVLLTDTLTLGEEVLEMTGVVGPRVIVPLPLEILLVLLDDAVLEVPVALLLIVGINDEVVVVRFVTLVIAVALIEVELKPLELLVLIKVLLFEEAVKLEGVDVIVGSEIVDTLVDPDEDDDDPVNDELLVEELEPDGVLVDEVEPEEDLDDEALVDDVLDDEVLAEEVLVEEVLELVLVFLVVDDELVVGRVPSTQAQSSVSSGALYFLNGDVVLDLSWMLVRVVLSLGCY